MTVFVVYLRGSPQHLRVFSSRREARRYVERQEWPHTWVTHKRRVIEKVVQR